MQIWPRQSRRLSITGVLSKTGMKQPFYLICPHRYTQEQLYSVVSDVAHYKEFVPWCQRSVITQEKPPDFVEAELEVGFKMFVERFVFSTVDNYSARWSMNDAERMMGVFYRLGFHYAS